MVDEVWFPHSASMQKCCSRAKLWCQILVCPSTRERASDFLLAAIEGVCRISIPGKLSARGAVLCLSSPDLIVEWLLLYPSTLLYKILHQSSFFPFFHLRCPFLAASRTDSPRAIDGIAWMGRVPDRETSGDAAGGRGDRCEVIECVVNSSVLACSVEESCVASGWLRR